MSKREVYIVGAVRTAIGSFGGTLKAQGATGAILTTKAIYELHRTGGRYALATMRIGGGQGIAAVFERS
jgi:acetyl-CoA acetyltransferase